MWLSGFKWIFLIIGTTIGAGYASGRELWEFFGFESALAIILSSLLFFVCCYTIMKISFEKKTKHYKPVLMELMGIRLTSLYDGMIIVYLFTLTMVMVAGGGATLQALHIPYWYGVILISLLLIMLFFRGINGVTSANVLIMPFLIICLVAILLYFQSESGFTINFDLNKQRNWPSAFTFTALNILPIVAVLAAIGTKIKQKGEIVIASIGSAIILGSVSFIYNESLILIASEVMTYEIPLFAILKNYPNYMFIVMSLLLWGAIYTTAATGLLGLCTRLNEYVKLPFWLMSLFLLIIMIPLTNIGFSKLVSVLYPLYGVLNLYLLSSILLHPLLHRFEGK